MENLSLILWRERELLETMLYKLEIEQLVLAGGRTRWLATAAREVEAVVEQLRETELLRAVAADEAAASIGLSANPSLRALADAVDEPWHSILMDHRQAFINYTQEILEIATTNRELLASGEQSARETFLGMSDQPDSYAEDGRAVVDSARHRLLDQSI